MHKLIIAAVSAALLAAPAVAQTPAAAKPAVASAKLAGPAGADLGMVTFTEAPKGVLLKIEAKGLTPGWHGLHFHEKGDCSKADFTSAGAHVHGADKAVHGLLNAQANESGDLPNLHVGADGMGMAEVFTTMVSIKGAEGRATLLDADGSAVVVHASPDDHMSQPIGGAGARVACGVVK
ncbi:superoxide dismutase family protein [Phenylobacterium immobile]|uniref:superoxide dismutase family protein n=1 Tax=Phenylobacterium immobile TaxID=21 RepID=UPI000A70096A|nr:superoxide dismutase family protein [Phenylobacterium immobile]